MLGIVHRVIAGWLADQAGVERASAHNLNIHFHMLWLDGVYEPMATRPNKPRLHRTRAPTSEQLT